MIHHISYSITFPTNGISLAGQFSPPAGMGHGVQLAGRVPTEISAFRGVLSQQTICVLVGAALPRVLRIAEEDLQTGVEP